MDIDDVPKQVKPEMDTNDIQVKLAMGTNDVHVSIKQEMTTYDVPVGVDDSVETNYVPIQIEENVETKDVQLGVEIENLPQHVTEAIESNDDSAQIKQELDTVDVSLGINEQMESDDISEHEKGRMKSDDVAEPERDVMESNDVPEHEKDVMESNDVPEHEKDVMESNDVPEHEKDVIESNDVPEQVRKEMETGNAYLTKRFISPYTLQATQQDTYYQGAKPCKVSLSRFNEKTQNGHCIADGYICLENLGKGSYRIIPLHGKSVKRSEAISYCEDTDEDSEYEDAFQDIVLSDIENRDSSKTTEEEEHEVIQKKKEKALLRLLKAQVKSDEKEEYFKMTPFVDDKTFNEYMTFNADLMCPVCKKIMTTFSEWKKHFYYWNACSAVFVNKKECCFSCRPCKQSFDEFTSWSVHMFMAGPHGKMRYVAFPKGVLAKKSYYENEHTSGNNPGVELVIDEKTKETSEQNCQKDDDFDKMFEFQVGFVCKCRKTSIHRYETRAIRHIYEQHLQIENRNHRYKCKVCSMYFHSVAIKWQHIRKHHRELGRRKKEKLCDICGKWYRDKSHLVTHETRKVPCTVCGSLIKEDAIGLHLRKHYRPKRKQGRIICDICNKSIGEGHFKEHLRVHSDRRRVQCTVCGKSLWPKCMSSHMLLHDDKLVNHFMCDICGRQYTHEHYLRLHIKNVHEKHKREKERCTICGAKVMNLYAHMVKHKERKYICDICGKKFSLKHHLTTHVKGVHENLRPFECMLCGFKFTLRHHLESHMKTSHKSSVGSVGKKETVELNSLDQKAFKNDKGILKTGKTVHSRGKKSRETKNRKKNVRRR